MLPLAWLIQRDALKATATFLAYFVIILAHEVGHAWVARRHGFAVFALRIYPVLGLCQHERPFLESQRIAIAWGGVAAQALLIAAGITVTEVASLAGMTLPPTLDSVLMVWVVVNLMILLFNLWPVPPLDGATAWRVLPLMWKRWRMAAPMPRSSSRTRRKLRVSQGLAPRVVAFDRSRRSRDNDSES